MSHSFWYDLTKSVLSQGCDAYDLLTSVLTDGSETCFLTTIILSHGIDDGSVSNHKFH